MSLISLPTAGSNALRSRAYNRSLVLRHVRATGASGRAQIARESGLSTQAVSNIIADLVAEGWRSASRCGPRRYWSRSAIWTGGSSSRTATG